MFNSNNTIKMYLRYNEYFRIKYNANNELKDIYKMFLHITKNLSNIITPSSIVMVIIMLLYLIIKVILLCKNIQ